MICYQPSFDTTEGLATRPPVTTRQTASATRGRTVKMPFKGQREEVGAGVVGGGTRLEVLLLGLSAEPATETTMKSWARGLGKRGDSLTVPALVL